MLQQQERQLHMEGRETSGLCLTREELLDTIKSIMVSLADQEGLEEGPEGSQEIGGLEGHSLDFYIGMFGGMNFCLNILHSDVNTGAMSVEDAMEWFAYVMGRLAKEYKKRRIMN